jgi:hypothetical protein
MMEFKLAVKAPRVIIEIVAVDLRARRQGMNFHILRDITHLEDTNVLMRFIGREVPPNHLQDSKGSNGNCK